ncbi:MAG TPA: M48 family metalloprotease [Solirubrobacteraceae bacterium]|nr:M48 family metalloprotease [Solirubrobacteraceae bacterium]
MRPTSRLALALGGAVAAAEAAVVLLRPRGALIVPAPVEAKSYFSAEEIDRARAFRRPQRALAGAQAGLQLVALGVLARRPPTFPGAGRWGPVAGAACGGAALAGALDLATLPLGAIARRRAIRVGLVTQSWEQWALDLVKSQAIGGLFSGAAAATLVGLMRTRRERWWLEGSLIVTAAGAVMMALSPIVLDPLFNRFTPLVEGPVRADVLELAAAAGVSVGEVYEVDASRRGTAANAYVTGLGRTKRVVLFDTLLRDFSRDELRLVVAHELSHVCRRDVVRGLAYSALVAPPALYAVARLTERLAPPGAAGTPAVLPAAALSVGLVGAICATIANQLSRSAERQADAFALELTGAAEPFISFMRGIVVRNVAEPDPPRWLTALLASHPAPLERIGAAVAFATRPAPPRRRIPADS